MSGGRLRERRRRFPQRTLHVHEREHRFPGDVRLPAPERPRQRQASHHRARLARLLPDALERSSAVGGRFAARLDVSLRYGPCRARITKYTTIPRASRTRSAKIHQCFPGGSGTGGVGDVGAAPGGRGCAARLATYVAAIPTLPVTLTSKMQLAGSPRTPWHAAVATASVVPATGVAPG